MQYVASVHIALFSLKKHRVAFYHNIPLNLKVKSVLLKMNVFEVKQPVISIWFGYQCQLAKSPEVQVVYQAVFYTRWQSYHRCFPSLLVRLLQWTQGQAVLLRHLVQCFSSWTVRRYEIRVGCFCWPSKFETQNYRSEYY